MNISNNFNFTTYNAKELAVLSRIFIHDLNNYIGAIIGSVSVMELELKTASGEFKNLIDDDVDTVKAASEKTVHCISQYQNFFQNLSIKNQKVEMRELINSVVEYVKTKINNDIVIKQFSEEMYCMGDYELFARTLYEVIVNACEASLGEKVTINCNIRNADEIMGKLAMDKGKCVVIEVIDKGPGIAKEDKKEIFKAFFSGKENHKGLGLTLVYAILRQYKGAVHIDRKNDETVAGIYIPL